MKAILKIQRIVIDKCDALKAAITAAYNSPTINQSTNVAKLFMAPEFYFRGVNGAYNIANFQEIIPNMETLICEERFNDWIFVLGTAIAHFTHEEGETIGGMSLKPAVEEVFNIALVCRGGKHRNKADGRILVYKEYVSAIDFIRLHEDRSTWSDATKRLAEIEGYAALLKPTEGSRDLGTSLSYRELHEDPTDRLRVTGYKPQNLKEYNPSQRGMGGGSIFVCGGIRFALETCLDHLKGRVRNSIDAGRDSKVQIQLIPSAGASIKDDNIVTVQSGLIFNVDGLRAANRVQLKKRTNEDMTAAGAYGTDPIAFLARSVVPGLVGAGVDIFPVQDVPYAWSLRNAGLFNES